MCGTHNLLGVDTDYKTWILDDSWIVGEILVCHNVLHKLFWINGKMKMTNQILIHRGESAHPFMYSHIFIVVNTFPSQGCFSRPYLAAV